MSNSGAKRLNNPVLTKSKVREDEWKLEPEIEILCLKQRKTQCFGLIKLQLLPTNGFIRSMESSFFPTTLGSPLSDSSYLVCELAHSADRPRARWNTGRGSDEHQTPDKIISLHHNYRSPKIYEFNVNSNIDRQ
jgi:hypothetical protein